MAETFDVDLDAPAQPVPEIVQLFKHHRVTPEPLRAHRRFILKRRVDHSGVSGTGNVAEGVVWTDGTVTLRWHGEHVSLVHWQSMDHMLAVHGHAGDTFAALIDSEDEV